MSRDPLVQMAYSKFPMSIPTTFICGVPPPPRGGDGLPSVLSWLAVGRRLNFSIQRGQPSISWVSRISFPTDSLSLSRPLSLPLSPLSPPRSSASSKVLVTTLRVSRELPDVHAKHEILKWVLRGIRTVRPCVFHLDQPQTMSWNMVEPTGSEKASSIVFQLHLEGSETSQMSQRNSSKPICVFWPACSVTLRN